MPVYRKVNTDHTGGLMRPYMRGRIDIEKYNKGLQECNNFIPTIQGPLKYREGFEWIRAEEDGNVEIIHFSINNDNRFLLALSAGKINIYSRAGVLLYTRENGVDDGFGNIVNLPYTSDQIPDVRYSREIEKIIFTHPLHPTFVLTANSIYDELALYAVSEYVTTGGVDANINGTFDMNGTVNSKQRWTLFSGLDEYWDIENDGAGKWQLIVGADHPTLTPETVYYEVAEGANPQLVPETGWSNVTGTTMPTLTEGISELQDSAATPLYAGVTGSEGLTPWKWEQLPFTSHPFNPIDTSNTVVRLSDAEEIIALVSTDTDFSGIVGVNMNTNVTYTEYKVGNQWGLGRILDSNTTPAAPADPTTTTVYVQPVDKVVNIEDPSVRLCLIEGNASAAPWTEADGVPDGDYHVRADSAIFKTADIGAWIRIGGNQLFTNVCDPVDSADYNSQDGNIRWAQIVDYRGIEDHPVDFLYDEVNNEDLDSGSVYEIYDWGISIVKLSIMDGSGLKEDQDRSAFVRKDRGTPRFTMNVYAINGGTATGTSTLTEPTGPYASTDMIIANMSTQRQFDVVEVDTVYVQDNPTYPKLISPIGTITAYDLVTDPDGLASHTATLTASKIFFDAVRDNGRYILGQLVDDWVLLKINGNSTTDYTAEVDVLSSIPRDSLTGDLANEGVFTKFRLGAWYTDNYPYTVSYYEQRRVFAGTRQSPNLVWFSKVDDPGDFRTAEDDGTVLDTTGITYSLGTNSTIIRWIAPGATMVIGTESNEWQLRPNEFAAALSPTNIRILQETSIGSIIQGERVGAVVFFPHISGENFHEFKFDYQTQQFEIVTTTKLAPDLFEDDPIVSFAYQFHPNACFWIVTESGKLKSLTYRKEDDFYAWAEHDIGDGLAKNVTVLSKGDQSASEDQLWIIIERGGSNQLERLAPAFSDDLSDNYKLNAAYLDSYVRNPTTGTLSSPTTSVSVPSRVIVDGQTRLVVDGVDLGLVSVSAGANTIPGGVTASQYTLVGLPYTGKIQMNPLALDNGAGKNSYGQIKRTVSMRPYVYKSMGYKVGFDTTTTEEIAAYADPALYTGFMDEHNIINSIFDVDKMPLIIQDQPYPLTLVSTVLKVDMA